MDIVPYLIAFPAVIALFFKAGIFAYARHSHVQNQQTRLYLYFLFALSIQNVAEVIHFYILIVHDAIPATQATIYYAASTIALALLLHLAFSLASNGFSARKKAVLTFVYGYAAALEVLLLSTP